MFKNNKRHILLQQLKRDESKVLQKMKQFLKVVKTDIDWLCYHNPSYIIEFAKSFCKYPEISEKERMAFDIEEQVWVYIDNLIFQYFDPVELIKAFVSKVIDADKAVEALLNVDLWFNFDESYTSSDITTHLVNTSIFLKTYLKYLGIKFPGILQNKLVCSKLRYKDYYCEILFEWDGCDEGEFFDYVCRMVLGRIQSYRMEPFGIEFYATPTKMPEKFPMPKFDCNSLVGKYFEFKNYEWGETISE
ncbi:hypothetical protein HDV01_007920 [Terramyces sp. JEL0728]|nr:hypothetical protein HDV01_007920 [Terramyces sp. JEL0728]